MDVNEYPSNSYEDREPIEKTPEANKPKVESVVSGKVISRKKSVGRKIADAFKGDDAKSVGEYILLDIAVPAFKSMITDMVTEGLERALNPSGPNRTRRTSTFQQNYTSFSKPTTSRVVRGEPAGLSHRARATHDFNELIIPNRTDAEVVMDQLLAMISDYGVVTVADLYELVGENSDYTDRKWGWKHLNGANIRRVNGGYLLELPDPRVID